MLFWRLHAQIYNSALVPAVFVLMSGVCRPCKIFVTKPLESLQSFASTGHLMDIKIWSES